MGQPAQRQEPATNRNPHGRPLPWSLPCHRRTVAPAASKRRQLEFHSAPSNSRSFSWSSCRGRSNLASWRGARARAAEVGPGGTENSTGSSSSAQPSPGPRRR